MPTLKIINHVIVDIDGRPIEAGSLTNARTLTVTGNVHEQVVTVAASTTVKIFDVDDDLSNFDFLLIETDLDLMLELVTDDDNDVGERSYTLPLIGSGTSGTYGVPFMLGADDSYANHTVVFAGGTLDVIETIRVRNLDTADTARCHILAVT